MQIFPFTIYNVKSNEPWFDKWFAENRKMLAREHGSYYYTGNTESDREKKFSYYQVAAEFQSSTQVTFRFYNMESMVSGGRGDLRCKVEAAIEVDDSLRELLKKRMHYLAELEYDRREKERLEKIREQAIDAIEAELFADFKF